MQPANRQAMVDSPLTQSKRNKLPARHHPMLLLRQASNLGVPGPSPRQATNIGG